ncbi:MAG TPA: hypothetical protein VEK07_02865 [Polyangiaceae bacterium]|nr:hypothetical protein [Polyangiaceae bacterium]
MTAKKTINKSDFIRQQPDSMSAAEVVAKAKAEGLAIRPGLVYEVRRTAKVRKPTTAKKTPISTKTGVPSNTSNGSKAAFVRARAQLSPKEIVEDAQAAGIKLDVSYVYNVRGAAKAKSKTKATKQAARTARKAASVGQPIATSSKAEDLLRAVAAEVGLARAIEVLLAQRAQVHAVLRG